MANTLTGLIPTIYRGVDKVSRELVGFIPSVSRDVSESMAAKDQVIRVPIAPTSEAVEITPGLNAPDAGDQAIGYADMSITKSYQVPIRWNGEEHKSMDAMGEYDVVLADQFAQAMRTLSNLVEADLADLYKKAGNASVTSDAFKNVATFADAYKALVDNGTPVGNLNMVIGTLGGSYLRSLTNLTKANEAGSDATLRRGVLLDMNGFAIRESAKVKSHTAGAGTSDTASGSVGDKELSMSSISAGDYLPGDVITIAGDPNKYVVASSDHGSNKITLTTGLKMAASSAAVTVNSDFTANMAFDADALKLLARAPAMPEGGDMADDVITVSDPVSGLPFQIAIYRQYRQVKFEVGIAWGTALVKPEHSIIVVS